MKLDDLMEVWRSQDETPLHDMNKTLLHLALRQDEARLQRVRRRERWIIYLTCAGFTMGLAAFIALLVYNHRTTAGDFALLAVGAGAALAAVRALYLAQRRQNQRERNFGESLHGQLQRSIAQLDDQATQARRTTALVTVLMGGVCPAVILLASWRINQKSISDDGYLLVSMILICGWSVASSVWDLRRHVQRNILPQKKRLEELLQELDGQ